MREASDPVPESFMLPKKRDQNSLVQLGGPDPWTRALCLDPLSQVAIKYSMLCCRLLNHMS